jgi:hypothetical protein
MRVYLLVSSRKVKQKPFQRSIVCIQEPKTTRHFAASQLINFLIGCSFDAKYNKKKHHQQQPMSVSSSSTSARSLLSNAEVMPLNLSTRRARLAFTLRTLLSILLLTGWTYASDWGLQMCLVLRKNNTNISKVWILLSILAFLTAAWTFVALLRLVWKDRQGRHYSWSWRPSAAGGGGNTTSTDREWTRSMPAPSVFFYVSFREAFSLEDDRVLSNEDIKKYLVRLLTALHIWPVFMLFLFFPLYMRLLHKYDDWRVSVPSSIVLIAVAAVLYKYVVLGCDSSNREAEDDEPFFLFPESEVDPSSTLSVGLLTPRQQDEPDDDEGHHGSREHKQNEDQPPCYRDVENL